MTMTNMALPSIKDDEYGEENAAVFCDDGFHARGRQHAATPDHLPGSIGEEWEVRDIRGNKSGVYFALNVLTKGNFRGIVTVKVTDWDTAVCFTHNAADKCAHARFVRRHIKAHPELLTQFPLLDQEKAA